MKYTILLISTLLVCISASSQSLSGIAGDWVSTYDTYWKSETGSPHPVKEVIRIKQSDSGDVYLQKKIISATDNQVLSYHTITFVSSTATGFIYSEIEGNYFKWYFELVFDGDVAKRNFLYYIDIRDGQREEPGGPKGEVRVYYKEDKDW